MSTPTETSAREAQDRKRFLRVVILLVVLLGLGFGVLIWAFYMDSRAEEEPIQPPAFIQEQLEEEGREPAGQAPYRGPVTRGAPLQ